MTLSNQGQEVPTGDRPETADRFSRTVAFVMDSLTPPATILDLGETNPLADCFRERGYSVLHTEGDLDIDPAAQVAERNVDAVTAFEILEHLVAPFNVLRAITAPQLFVTVPLRLWFSRAYRSRSDMWDRHFHEFEDWQFDWLLEKAGWEIVRRDTWTPRPGGIPLGIRPLLRRVTPRWYAVEAKRLNQ